MRNQLGVARDIGPCPLYSKVLTPPSQFFSLSWPRQSLMGYRSELARTSGIAKCHIEARVAENDLGEIFSRRAEVRTRRARPALAR